QLSLSVPNTRTRQVRGAPPIVDISCEVMPYREKRNFGVEQGGMAATGQSGAALPGPVEGPHPRATGRSGSGFGDVAVGRFEGEGVRVRAATHTGVQGIDPGQFVGGERKVEHVEVFRDTGRLDRLRDRGPALLQVPAQHDLCGCLAVSVGDLADHRVVERRPAGVAAVAGDPAYW